MSDAPTRRTWLVPAAVAAVGLASLLAWQLRPARPPAEPVPPNTDPPDPRLTIASPYRNVKPDVKYVGDAACAECHADHAETYAHHPMGQALFPIAAAPPIEKYDAAAKNPFPAGGLHYAVERRDGKVFHREWAADAAGKPVAVGEAEVRFAVGSGARARSYAIERDGFLFQSPLTWYPQTGRWDLSPSYEIRNQHLGRPITPGCLFCHANQIDHVPDTVNRYREPIFHGTVIGCERCHGPGELHVKKRATGDLTAGFDDTIVNPARLEHSLREAVCQQCHVQGEQRVLGRGRGDFDFRPGLPLHPFLMDFVDATDQRADVKFVSSVEQMQASRCFAASKEPKKLGCVSCHDPHRHPATAAEKVAHYRKRCLGCHTDTSCSLPPATRREKNKDDSCIACHMPNTGSEINHTSITDHRVPRRPGPAAKVGASHRPTPGPDELAPFHRALIPAGDPEAARNLGMAVVAMLDRGMPADVGRRYAAKALPLLDAAAARDPGDLPARTARADALFVVGRGEESFAEYEAVLAVRPGWETALHGAGLVALGLNRPDEARAYLERAAKINPQRWQYPHSLGVAAFRRGEWDRSAEESRRAVRLEPAHAGSRSLLVQALLGAGRRETAAAEYEVIRALTPEAKRPDLARWFDEQRRRFRP